MKRNVTRLNRVLLLAIFASVCLSGCALFGERTRTIYIPPGTPTQLRQDLEADVWAFDKDGKQVEGHIRLKNGWWVLPDTDIVRKEKEITGDVF